MWKKWYIDSKATGNLGYYSRQWMTFTLLVAMASNRKRCIRVSSCYHFTQFVCRPVKVKIFFTQFEGKSNELEDADSTQLVGNSRGIGDAASPLSNSVFDSTSCFLFWLVSVSLPGPPSIFPGRQIKWQKLRFVRLSHILSNIETPGANTRFRGACTFPQMHWISK